MIGEGVINAINLDGGGSESAVVNGSVVNYPSDQCSEYGGLEKYGCERPVASITCMHHLGYQPVAPYDGVEAPPSAGIQALFAGLASHVAPSFVGVGSAVTPPDGTSTILKPSSSSGDSPPVSAPLTNHGTLLSADGSTSGAQVVARLHEAEGAVRNWKLFGLAAAFLGIASVGLNCLLYNVFVQPATGGDGLADVAWGRDANPHHAPHAPSVPLSSRSPRSGAADDADAVAAELAFHHQQAVATAAAAKEGLGPVLTRPFAPLPAPVPTPAPSAAAAGATSSSSLRALPPPPGAFAATRAELSDDDDHLLDAEELAMLDREYGWKG